MGKFDGKQIIGLVGRVVFRKKRDGKGIIVQSSPDQVKQTTGTKQASGVFGNASALSKRIRESLQDLYDKKNTGDVGNMLNKINREQLEHCYDKLEKTYTFREDSFNRMKGINFNTLSPLSKQLWIEPEIIYSNGKVLVSFPEIRINKDLLFPEGTNLCDFRLMVTRIIPVQSLYTTALNQSFEVSNEDTIVSSATFEFDVPEGCLCVVGLCLDYYYSYNGNKSIFNNEKFNPTMIIGALLTPGTFVEPPLPVEPNRGFTSDWSKIDKMNLPIAQ